MMKKIFLLLMVLSVFHVSGASKNLPDSLVSAIARDLPRGWKVTTQNNALLVTYTDSISYWWFKHDLNPDTVIDYKRTCMDCPKMEAEIRVEVLSGKDHWTDSRVLAAKRQNDQIDSTIHCIKGSNEISAAMEAYRSREMLRMRKIRVPLFRNELYTVFIRNNMELQFLYFYTPSAATPYRDFEDDLEKIRMVCSTAAEKWLRK